MCNLNRVVLFLFLIKLTCGLYFPIIETKDGQVRGNILTSRHENSFYSFRGIPYAKPPINELRFKDPQPIEPWTNIFDATVDGPLCPQAWKKASDMSEDCLKLNVYTRALPNTVTKYKKPVILYIHGGGFYVGSGVSWDYGGPEYLMDRDVVFVTINYRLGALGFMSLGTSDCPGNAGFKDQVLAMKWVRDNIEQFGGDPDSITIIGNSSGASSITLHMISPMSEGLFHKAIIMSSAVSTIDYFEPHRFDIAQYQATLMNCSTETPEIVYKCLMTVDAIEMAELSFTSHYSFTNPLESYGVVVEPDFEQDRFLIYNNTFDLFKNGNFMKVPVLIGVTENEIAEAAVMIITGNGTLERFDLYFDILVNNLFKNSNDNFNESTPELMRSRYDLHSPLSEDHLPQLVKFISDTYIGFDVHRFVNLISNITSTFYYKFTFQGRYSHLYHPEDKPYGVEHSDDMLYLIPRSAVAPRFKTTDPESLTVEHVSRLWSRFALTGNPNDPEDEITNSTTWPAYDIENEYFLNIGNSLEVEQGLNNKRFEIWDKLFPIDRE